GAALLERVEAWLVEAVGVLLKVKRENVDLDAELGEFGFDSISLTGLANYVNQAHGLEVMPTIFFEHPTLRRFARYLLEKHGETLAQKFQIERRPAASAATALQERVEQSLMNLIGVVLEVKGTNEEVEAAPGGSGSEC